MCLKKAKYQFYGQFHPYTCFTLASSDQFTRISVFKFVKLLPMEYLA